MKRLLSLCICIMSFFVTIQLSFGSEEQAQEQENASNPLAAVNIDGLFGIGGDRSFDWGVGLGVRFNY